MNRSTLCVLLGLALLWAGWSVGRQAAREVVVLRIPDAAYADRYVTLWAVDDEGRLWLRAARPDRKWLGWLREPRQVEIERDGEVSRYQAEIFPGPGARERVDELMREKYGRADQVRELLLGTDTVPVRLDAVD